MLKPFLGPFLLVSRSWHPLSATLGDEIRRRYAGSAFGLGWVFLVPILFLALYASVYLWIYKVKPADITPVDYVLFVYVGLIPFLSFVDSLSVGTGSLVTNRSILLNTVFPAELLPVRAVLAAQSSILVGMTICLTWAAIDNRLTLAALTVPYFAVCQILFLIGLVWFFAPLYVVFKDLGQIINFLCLLMLAVSPIAFRAAELKGTAASLAQANPLYYFLIAYQAAIFDGRVPPAYAFWTVGIMSILTFVLGFNFCARVKLAIADHV